MKSYNNSVALDWAQSNMAIAWCSGDRPVKTIDVAASISELKVFLKSLKGTKILTFEETTTSQWLWTELRECVDEILVCDPYRNKLLSEGPKTDKIDAQKLLKLLKADMLKPVFHSGNHFMELRKLVSGYEDLIQMGVQLKNRRSAIFRALGKEESDDVKNMGCSGFILEGIDKSIDSYEEERSRYVGAFEKLTRKYKTIKNIETIPGIGVIGAVKIAAVVVDAKRFPSRHHFFSYSGLVKHDRISGGKSYGQKAPRYCRRLKSVFKTAALSVIREGAENPFRNYYLNLLKTKNYAEHDARHAVARRVATVVYGVMKNGQKFNPERLDKTVHQE